MIPWLFGFQNPTISLDVEVGSIVTAVRKLSEVSDIPLKVEGVALNETVFLHVENQPIKDVLDKLAKVTTSQWVSDGRGGLTLQRPKPLIDEAVSEENRQRLDLVKKWQAGVDKPQNQTSLSDLEIQFKECKSDFGGAKAGKVIEEAFLQPFYKECLKRIDASTIAKIWLDDRVVFSSSPTPRQLPIDPSIKLRIKELNKSLALWRLHLKQAGLSIRPKPIEPSQFEFEIFRDHGSNGTLPFARPIKTIILTFTGGSYHTVKAVMSLVDDRGRVAAAALCGVLKVESHESQPEIDLPRLANMPAPAQYLPTRALCEATDREWNKSSNALTESEISKALAPYFDDPVNHDFLHLGNQEFLEAIGPAFHRSVIACVPDGQYMPYQEQSVANFVNARIGDDTSCAVTADWIEFFPTNAADHWRNRGHREVLARCAKTWREQGRLTMQDVVNLTPPGANSYSRLEEFAQLMMPSARHNHYNAQFAFTNFSGMRELLGSLSDGQLNALHSGAMIRYGDLSQSQRRACESIVYGSPANRMIGGKSANVNAWEPTLELPNGLNPKLGIRAKFVTEHYVIAHDPNEPPDKDIRETIGLDSRPERFNGQMLTCGNYARANRWMKFEFRTRQRFSLRCYLTRTHYYSVDYYEPMSPDKGQRLTVDQLPKDLVAQMEKQNHAFNSRIIMIRGADGQERMKVEKYQKPKRKKTEHQNK